LFLEIKQCVLSPPSVSKLPQVVSPTNNHYEWVSVDESEDERLVGFSDDFVLGLVPSMDEVHDAVTALTQ
jgi:hypothetical protein